MCICCGCRKPAPQLSPKYAYGVKKVPADGEPAAIDRLYCIESHHRWRGCRMTASNKCTQSRRPRKRIDSLVVQQSRVRPEPKSLPRAIIPRTGRGEVIRVITVEPVGLVSCRMAAKKSSFKATVVKPAAVAAAGVPPPAPAPAAARRRTLQLHCRRARCPVSRPDNWSSCCSSCRTPRPSRRCRTRRCTPPHCSPAGSPLPRPFGMAPAGIIDRAPR